MRLQYQIIRYTLLFIVIVVLAYLAAVWISFLETPAVKSNQTINYILKPGTGFNEFVRDLQQLNIMPHPKLFAFLAKLTRAQSNLKAGWYRFQGPLKPNQLLNMVVQGKILKTKLTLVEGWTFNEVMQAINNNDYLTHTLQNKTPAEIMSLLGYPNQHPEGLFYPDTYHFPAGMTDVKFLQRAYQTMQSHLQTAWQNRQVDLPYKTPYQALIAASLIEKETAVAAEKSEIAGVLVRRLRKNMLLQFDPTVIYGLGSDYDGNITRADLTKDTPYNTYVHVGLPPTPIAMPAQTSIEAALNPAAGNTLYFVAKGDGSHVFSATLAEHKQAVNNYLKLRKQTVIPIKNQKVKLFSATPKPLCKPKEAVE